ncbi:hypothetical protein ElyMa_002708100 [Elysia marginata]|uniref:Major facilitator superfamily (MFS) profile domain-containing protein n=1 Tax=Elysia marginata TaxID=1093978 RepID=A0AAV4HCS9_9GAST|nr:hypothetical protein ElyMa_002708100 [Elysia marginata]
MFTFILLAVVDLVCLVLMFFVPETKKLAMLETLEEDRLPDHSIDPSHDVHIHVRSGTRPEDFHLSNGTSADDQNV